MNFHKKALLIGAVTISLCAAVVLWLVVLDKGTFQIAAEAPYTVELTGKSIKGIQKVSCTKNPCSVSLSTGDYSASLFKTGYYEEARDITIQRGQTLTVKLNFVYIPLVETVGNFETYETVFIGDDLSSYFTFEMDPEYDKQMLVFTDSETDEDVTWAYFDRALESPFVMPRDDLKAALVADRAGTDHSLYLIDGEQFSRSYLGMLPYVNDASWSADGSQILVKTFVEGEEWGSALWLMGLATGAINEWPFGLELRKVAWDGTGRLVFVTDQNLEAIEGEQMETPVDMLKGLMEGEFQSTEAVAFVIGQYDPETENYRVLYEVPSSFGMDFEEVFMISDTENSRLYFSDGATVYEVVREI